MKNEETAYKYVVKFSKPVRFEGKEYREIDLSGLEDMTTEQLRMAERLYERSGAFSALKEMNVEYCCYVAAVATGMPIELFWSLSAKDGTRIKSKVSSFFMSEE